ncbi:MAG: SBBP repeat-containing protein [Candidatus Thorarchaeota archaeon]
MLGKYHLGFITILIILSLNPVSIINTQRSDTDSLSFLSNNFIPKVEEMVSTGLFQGGSRDEGIDVVCDDLGYIYITGNTDSSDFPVTDAYDDSFNGDTDCFVMKLTPDLNTIVYASYFGGESYDNVEAIGIDTGGYIYLAGSTNSLDFPLTHDYSVNKSTRDAFIMKLDPSDGTPIFSIRLGGSDTDGIQDMDLDEDAVLYVTGSTHSSDFYLHNPFDSTLNGTIDGFLASFQPNGSIVHSSYFGGSEHDYADGIKVGTNNLVHIVGGTNSDDFPTAPLGDTELSGSLDSFLITINSTDYSIQSSNLFGGTEYDSARAIDIDTDGNLYVAGSTNSADFPMANSIFDVHRGGDGEVFLMKLNPIDYSLNFSTFLGGYNSDRIQDMKCGENGITYLTGFTLSRTFPTEDPLSLEHYGDLWDGFVAKIDTIDSELEYSSFLGGSGGEAGYGLAVLPDDSIVVTGQTDSNDFVGCESDTSILFVSACFVSKIYDLTDGDNDNLRDIFEEVIGTDCTSVDSDNDGFDDYWEYVNGYDPMNPDVGVLEYLHFHIVWVIGLPTPFIAILVLYFGKHRLRILKNDVSLRIGTYKQQRITNGPIPRAILSIILIVTLFSPNAMIPWRVYQDYFTFERFVEGALFAPLWVILPEGSNMVGFYFLDPVYLSWCLAVGALNFLFMVQVFRFWLKKVSWRKLVASGILTLIPSIVYAIMFISYTYGSATYATYMGPIPIQLAVGLIICWLIKTDEVETPWIEESTIIEN